MLFGWSIVGKMHYHIRINTEITHKWKMDLSKIVVAKCRILHGRLKSTSLIYYFAMDHVYTKN